MLAKVGRLLCVAGATLAGLALLGSITGASFFTTIVPGHPPMMPNTAAALLLAGAAAAFCDTEAKQTRRTLAVLLAALVVLVLGLGTLAEYALQVDLEIDHLVFPSRVGPHPGRPSPPTALAITLLGAALLLSPARHGARRIAQWLVLGTAFIAFVALLGNLFGASRLYGLGRMLLGVSLPTALSLLLTALGLLLQRPDEGVMGVATSSGPGGILLRRLMPVAILAPVALGFIGMRALQTVGVEHVRLVFAILVAATTVISLVLLTVTAIPLNRAQESLATNRAQTGSLIELASDGIFVANLEGRYIDVNTAGCRLLGYSREAILEMTILDLIPPGEAERLARDRQQLLEGQIIVSEWRLRRKDGTYVPAEVSAKILPDGRWQGFVRDISERKQAEARIRQSEERLDLALRGADLASWDWNIETGAVICNPRWAQMRGYRPEEIAPTVDSWIVSIHPEDWPNVERALAAHLEGQTPDYETEHRVRTKTGNWIWILDRGRVVVRDERGRPLRMAGTVLDVTERKRAQEALRISEARASGILSISSDAIISIDESQRITMFNEGAERIFGYTKAEVTGAPLDVLLPERSRGRHRQHVERFVAGQEIARRMGESGMAISGLRNDGTEFPADAAISKLEVAGKPVLTVVLRDVTEQRRLDSEQRFLAEVGSVLAATLEYDDTLTRVANLAVQELADFCVISIVGDRDEIEHLKVASRDPSKASVSDAIAQLLLDPRRSQLVRRTLDVTRPALLQDLPPELVAWSRDNDDETILALRRASPRSAILVPLLARSHRFGTIALVSSTPSRPYGPADVQLAERLAHRAGLSIDNARLYSAAQGAIRAREEVLGIVAHDLRNPLGTMLMQAELLRLQGSDPERRPRKPADVIERAAKRMSRMIQDLLDATRIEAGHLSLKQARLGAGQIVADSVEAQRPHASAASLGLEVELADGTPEVWADRDRLLQVFENLIGNAIKFTPPGGQIRIGAGPRNGEVLFWVRDSGVGIAAEDLPRLFDRFWQAHKGERRGAGLGLPIVKGIVETHGGRIWAESAPGRGSVFFFTIPTTPGAEPWRGEQAPHVP